MYRLFIIIIVFVLLYGVYLYISVKTIDKNKTPVLLPMGKLEDIQKEIELINENLPKGHKNLTMAIYENSIKYDLDWKIILSVIKTESSWDSLAKSPKGAKGLMQIMPIMAQVYSSLYFNGKEFNLYNLTDTLNIGSRILYDKIKICFRDIKVIQGNTWEKRMRNFFRLNLEVDTIFQEKVTVQTLRYRRRSI